MRKTDLGYQVMIKRVSNGYIIYEDRNIAGCEYVFRDLEELSEFLKVNFKIDYYEKR